MAYPHIHHRVLTTLTYGEFDWLVRHPTGWLTAPFGALNRTTGLRRWQAERALQTLVRVGVIEELRVYPHYAMLKLKVPPGLGRLVNGQ